MEQPVIGKNHQLSLPPGLLKRLDLQAGQTFICIVKGDVISLVPKRDMQSVRGLLKGVNIENYRDQDERV